MIRVIFIFLCLNKIYSQEVVVLDLNSKKEIAYASIQYSKNIGTYTNNNGRFTLLKNKSDYLKVYHIGYYDTIIKYSTIKDTIYLKSKTVKLNEIEILTGKYKKKKIGYNEEKSNLFLNIKEKTELATLIQYKKKYKAAILKKIFIPIDKMYLNLKNGKYIESYPDFNSVFRFKIYSNSNGKPGLSLLEKPILIKCNQDSPNIIEIDISKDFINLPKNGVFIGIEMIGMLNVKEDEILTQKNEILLPAFKFTNKRKNYISSKSYIKTIFNEKKWGEIGEFNKKIKNLSDYNMAISIILNIYK